MPAIGTNGRPAEPDAADELWAHVITGAGSEEIRAALSLARAVEADRWAAAFEEYAAELSPNLVWGGDVTAALRAITAGLRGMAQ